MRWAGYILVTIALIAGVVYLSWYNAESVDLRLGEAWTISAPLAVQLILAFVAGALLVIVGTAMRESQLAVARWRQRRRARRETRLDALIEEGRQALWDGNPDRARSLLLRAWRSRPSRETLLLLVDAYLQSDGAAEARRLFQQLDGAVGDDPDVLWALATICRRMGDTTAAITTLERTRGRYPRAARILTQLRDLYIDAGRWDEAASVHSEYLAVRGQSSVPSEQNVLAGVRYEAAMRIPGRDARLSALEELASKFPKFVPAAVSLGDELVAANRTADAVRLWEYLLRQEPRAVLAERLADSAGDRKSRDRLRTVLRKLRGQNLNGDAAHLLAARLALADGDEDTAEKEIQEVSGDAQAAAFRLTEAEIKERRNQLAGALSAYRQAASEIPRYHCRVCGRPSAAWRAFCAPCRRWDTFRSSAELVRG